MRKTVRLTTKDGELGLATQYIIAWHVSKDDPTRTVIWTRAGYRFEVIESMDVVSDKLDDI